MQKDNHVALVVPEKITEGSVRHYDVNANKFNLLATRAKPTYKLSQNRSIAQNLRFVGATGASRSYRFAVLRSKAAGLEQARRQPNVPFEKER
jgi:hypothetical protein